MNYSENSIIQLKNAIDEDNFERFKEIINTKFIQDNNKLNLIIKYLKKWMRHILQRLVVVVVKYTR